MPRRRRRGSTGAVLNRVFQKAFQAAKHVRTHTGISSGQVSVANVAVDLALNIFGNLSSARVLVLGTGEIGEGTAKAFRSRGAGDLAVAGRRRRARGRGLAARAGRGTLSISKSETPGSPSTTLSCARPPRPTAVLAPRRSPPR